MSKEIVVVLKDGRTYAGNDLSFNHFTRQFELKNFVGIAGVFPPDEIKKIKTGKISRNTCDDRDSEVLGF